LVADRKPTGAKYGWLIKHWLGCAENALADVQPAGSWRAEVWKVCAADLMAAIAKETAAQ
jgi:hypothetical protein